MPVSTLARVLIVLGVALGIAGDALLNVSPWGLGLPLWIALAGGGLFFIVRASRIPITLRFGASLGAWVGLAAMFAWRDAGALRVANLAALVLVTGVLLCEVQPQFGAPIAWAKRLATRFGSMLWRGFDVIETWVRTRAPGSPESRRRTLAIVRGSLLTLPLTLVFGGLLASADAAFESLVTHAFTWNLDVEAGASHVFGFLLAAWVALGLLSAPSAGALMKLVPAPPPAAPKDDSSKAKSGEGWRVGLTEVGFVLGTLSLLFGSFVAVQFRYFFGGDAQVQTVAGLSYAEYARRGFFELVWVTALALPVLLGCGRVALREGPAGYRLFAGLGTLVAGLLLVIMASAWQRMGIYVEAYGLTALRLYVCATMMWIGGVLAWMMAVHLRRRASLFAPGAAALAIAAVLALNTINPDGLIADTNLERARRTGQLDAGYLWTLSLDAAPAIVTAMPKARETHRAELHDIVAEMERRSGQRDFRSWNLGQMLAERAIERSSERWAVRNQR